ncbi:sulfur transfer protein SirA [Buchnera aphidicola str. Ak (Acyrthosiphon kondoi)]|uniref:Sulfur carrier protein TusA n=1 Tax=Buchnera aphidicola str. Ak (Acyrthosiphon kondoi) TaxID=1005090 RepID=G2LNE7_9GAMM|nr:sulfurtransferase TusA [Buchnera aphidicola]AEO08785.1 sulfur transfer protein SirA [Buchnera aphidicola str. Ak (Acyrthosiphon kondoi)]WAI18411.1 MAG: sulfurtransferase TusA [Buchnera aphidicola (Acyrthosiphon caraganae)]
MKKKNIILNLIGLRCPESIMVIRKTIRNMKNNEEILILSDDPTTKRDIPNFCYFMEHQLLTHEIQVKPYRYLLKKGL